MEIRYVKDSDLELIAQLNDLQDDFKLNGREHSIIERIAMDGDESVAYGIVKELAEAIILVNPNMPRAKRAKALAELMQYAEFGTARMGIDQLHCFVKDDLLARMLERKFNFIRTKDIVLVKNLG